MQSFKLEIDADLNVFFNTYRHRKMKFVSKKKQILINHLF